MTSQELPLISIVTPTYQQAQWLEETVDSVLSQGYPKLEYVIVDGGSQDGTVEIIKKYEKHLKAWVSEPDRGQTHAINKGMAMLSSNSSGLRAYLNSDDVYLPETFERVSQAYLENHNEEAGPDLIHGRCLFMDEEGAPTTYREDDFQLGEIKSLEEAVDIYHVWWGKRQFVQPEVFWSSRIAQKVGAFNENLYYIMDYDYWLRAFVEGASVATVDEPFSKFRITSNQKSNDSEKVADELRSLVRNFLKSNPRGLKVANRFEVLAQLDYDDYFLKTVSESLDVGEAKWMRWLKLAKVLSIHPRIVFSEGFKDRWLSLR